MIEVEGLTKTFPGAAPAAAPAVNDINFSVQPGEVFGLLGANGAGKTTLLQALTACEPFQKVHEQSFWRLRGATSWPSSDPAYRFMRVGKNTARLSIGTYSADGKTRS